MIGRVAVAGMTVGVAMIVRMVMCVVVMVVLMGHALRTIPEDVDRGL